MQTILISGTSRGLGKALAERFLKNGDYVIGTSTTNKTSISHENFVSFQLDLADPKSIRACSAKITELNKPIDILINNAGIALEEEINQPTINPDYVRRILEINLIGTIDFTERIIPHTKKGGQIINISSRAGSLGFTGYKLNYPGYRISKAALNMVTRILAVRLEGKIRVSSIHPGWVRTDMGGEEGDLSPEEAAEDIFDFSQSDAETGQFWYKGEKFPW